MDVNKLHDAVDYLKDALRGNLIATDIFGVEDGQSIAGYNTQPTASALFARMVVDLNMVLKDGGFPSLGKYFLLDLVNDHKIIIVPMGKYAWGVLVSKDAQIGLITNVVLPKMIDRFEEALMAQ
ncbi:MAG: hypothetical protein Q7T80_08905 [Methanoregula sp.]|nr:hypothetical protein [Methanoregula sp.]